MSYVVAFRWLGNSIDASTPMRDGIMPATTPARARQYSSVFCVGSAALADGRRVHVPRQSHSRGCIAHGDVAGLYGADVMVAR